MLFTVSRASDYFADCKLPSSKWCPHPDAKWSEKIGNWMIDIGSLQSLIALCNVKGVRLIVKETDGPPHVEIDDVTENKA